MNPREYTMSISALEERARKLFRVSEQLATAANELLEDVHDLKERLKDEELCRCEEPKGILIKDPELENEWRCPQCFKFMPKTKLEVEG